MKSTSTTFGKNMKTFTLIRNFNSPALSRASKFVGEGIMFEDNTIAIFRFETKGVDIHRELPIDEAIKESFPSFHEEIKVVYAV